MQQQVRLKVNENGRIVIPAEFRKALGIEAGDEVLVILDKHELTITTQQQRIKRAQEHVRKYVKPGESLVDELLAERRAEASRE